VLTGQPPFPGDALEQVASATWSLHATALGKDPSAARPGLATGWQPPPTATHSAIEMLRRTPKPSPTHDSPDRPDRAPTPNHPRAPAIGMAAPPRRKRHPHHPDRHHHGEQPWRPPGVLIGALVAVAVLVAGAYSSHEGLRSRKP